MNQEDSLIVGQGCVDRGLFNGCKFTHYKTELEQREEFGNPDVTNTSDIKAGSYDKLKNGVIKKGTRIEKGDAVIGKYVRVNKTTDDDLPFSDRSTIYKETEQAIVHNVIVNRNEDDERFCKVSIRKPRPVAVGDKFCLTDEHEVFTTTGWKPIATVTTSDIVATLNQDTKHIEFHNPTETPNFQHTGKMYKVKARGVDLVTTLNHKMYTRPKGGDYSLQEANVIKNTKVYYKKDCNNNLDDTYTFTLPACTVVKCGKLPNISYADKSLDMDSWLEFLGMYMAEGWIDNSKCTRIAIHKTRTMTKMVEILDNLGYEYKIYDTEPDYMYIRDRQLSTYLEQFGKSTNRYIPEWCFTLSKRQSLLLLNGLLLSNGYHDSRKGSWEYYTGSKNLADGIQILSIMSGQSAESSIKNRMGDQVVIKGVNTTRNSDQYRVYISNYALSKEPLVGGATTSEELIDFSGTVYCITVPNNVFLTRRNNTYVWTGNSSRAG